MLLKYSGWAEVTNTLPLPYVPPTTPPAPYMRFFSLTRPLKDASASYVPQISIFASAMVFVVGHRNGPPW